MLAITINSYLSSIQVLLKVLKSSQHFMKHTPYHSNSSHCCQNTMDIDNKKELH